jgi:hypothetical protein
MAGNHRHDWPGPDAGARGWLARWSARKRASAPPGETPRTDTPAPVATTGAQPPQSAAVQKVLTDQDMPPLDTLNEESDYSGFLSPGVSEALQRLALRKLFRAAKYQVRDGLDDYDTDYNLQVPLRRTLAGVTQDALVRDLQQATGKPPLDGESAGDHPSGSRSSSAAEPAPQAPGAETPAGPGEQSGA